MKATFQRSRSEIVFIFIFIPILVIFYLIYKYPLWFVPEDKVKETFYWGGKSTSFWYNTVYTFIVCTIALKIILKNKGPYKKMGKSPLSSYQRNKFISIFFSQLIFFYFIPFILPSLLHPDSAFSDPYIPVNKDAYVYVYQGLRSLTGLLYIFVIVPLSVWYFGKRYCSWFCSCGNLAETIGTTVWGSRWVKKYTPRGPLSKKFEFLQYLLFFFSILFGLLLLFDSYKILIAPTLLKALWAFQHLAIDLLFGALIGVGTYPFWGTRIWCRFGCPLAAMMRLFGKYVSSHFAVVANKNCQGLNLCTQVCPMGIDVASFAHKDKIPLEKSFGLAETPCIGCGGCIDICPVEALSFKRI